MTVNRWLKHLFGSDNRTARRANRGPAWVGPRLVRLEDRTVPASLSATLDAGNNLTVLDTDGTGKANSFTVSVVGTDLVVTDAVEAFIAAPAGGTLSNGDKTLTISLASVGPTITINGAGGDDTYATLANTIPAAFNVVLTDNAGANAYTYDLVGATTATLASGVRGAATVRATAPAARGVVSQTDTSPTASTLTIANAATNSLQVTLNGGGTANGQKDTTTVDRVGANQVVSITDAVLGRVFGYSVPQTALNSMAVQGTADDDLLQMSWGTLGQAPLPASGLTYNAGAGGADGLEFTAGTVSDVGYGFTNETDGRIGVAGVAINYTGVDLTIRDGLTTTNGTSSARGFTYTALSETITLSDNGTPGDGRVLIDSDVGGGTVEFLYPFSTNSLPPNNIPLLTSISAGGGDDVININGLDTNNPTGFSFSGDAGNDVVNLNTDVTFYSNNRLFVQAEKFTTAPGVKYVGVNAGYSDIRANEVVLGAGSLLTAGSLSANAVIAPFSPGGTINLGGADGPGVLGLSAADLAAVAGPIINIGATSGNTAGVTVSSDVTFNLGAGISRGVLLNTATGNIVQNKNAGSITVSGTATVNVTANNLASRYLPLRTGTDITATQVGLAAVLGIDIEGTTADTDYTQFKVAGKINLGTASRLELTGSYVPQIGDVFTIAKATSGLTGTGTAIFKTLDGTKLTNNSLLPFNGTALRINYNTTSVTLTAVPSATATLDASNNLVLTGTDDNEDITLLVSGTDLVVTNMGAVFAQPTIPDAVVSDGGHTLTIPLASITGPNVIVDAGAGDDSLTVDFSGGSIPLGVQFNGGDGGTDTLVLRFGTTTGVTHTFANATDGDIVLTGDLAGTIAYTGVEPVIDNLSVDDRTYTFDSGADDVTVAAGGTLGNQISTALGATVDFGNPNRSLAVDAGADADTVTVAGLDGGFTAGLTIDGGADADAVNLNASIFFAGDNSLAVTAEQVTVGGGVALVTFGAGTISVTADALALDPSAALQSDGLVALQPQSADQAIDLGGDDTPGTLGLSKAELDTITAATLKIGTATSGAITLSDGIDLTDGPVVGALLLSTAKNLIVGSSPSVGIAVSKLGIVTGTGVASPAASLSISVDNFAAVGGTGGIAVQNGRSMTLGDVDPAITATSGGGIVQISASGNLTVAQPVTASGTGSVRLSAILDLIVQAGSPITTAGRDVQIFAGDLDLGAAVNVTTTSGSRVVLAPYGSSGAIDLGTDTDFGLTDAELDRITATEIAIGGANYAITITAPLSPANVSKLGLYTTGTIQTTNTGTPDITVGALHLTAFNGIGTGTHPLVLNVTTLTTDASGGGGNQFLTASSPVTIGDEDLLAGTGRITFVGGRFVLTSTGSINSSLQLSDGTGPGATVAGTGQVTGNVNVLANGTLSPGNSPGVIAITGDLTLTAGSVVAIEVNGAAAAGVDYDQIQVGGTVDLGGATLVTSGTGVGVGDTVRFIDNQGPNPIIGKFAGLAEGATRTINGVPLTITYAATGNDVALFTLASASIADVSAAEGDTGSTTFTFTVTLAAASSSTVTVDWVAADGTATTADGDYQSASGTVTFAPGQTTQTFTVTVNGDRKFEPDETFVVTLSNPAGTTLANTQAVGTILNDDPVPTASVGDVTQAEGNTGTTAFTFTVTLSNPSSSTVTVNYATSDGTALAGSDYQAATGTITFLPGETSHTVTILVTGDTTSEADETFVVNLSAATNATIAAGQGVGTITDDDLTPSISINNVTQAEGDAGTTAFTFTVSLSAASGKAVTVNYATADGTAVASSDYQAAAGTVTFLPGETSRTITVFVTGDTMLEADETFTVNLSAATNSTIGTGTATATITNDDPLPTVALSLTGSPFGENGGTATVTATLSNPSASPVTITLSFGGTAALGTDYDASAATIVIPPGALTGSITLTGRDNSLDAPDKTVVVTASAVTGGTAVETNQVTATITDDDRPVAVAKSYSTAEDTTLAVIAANGLLVGVTASLGSTAEVVGPGPAHGTLALQPDGSFTYTPAADFNGTDTFQYRVRNAAGEVSDPVTVSVGVAAVNDPPSFVKGPDQIDPRGTAAQTIPGWATAISAGPADESTQTLAFQVTTDNPGLFAVPPAIDPATGTLTYTPAAFAFGTAAVTVRLTDGGTGTNVSAVQTFTITVNKHPTESRPVGQDEQPLFAVGADAAGPAAVTVYRADGSVASGVTPFPGMTGGVRTAVADVNGDGVGDLVAGTGPGVVARVRAFDAVTGAMLLDITPFEDFTGGVFVAAGDITGDGRADIVVTPDLSGGPRVSVYRGGDFTRIANFFGIDDPNFRGGARSAAGDITGDGVADLVVSAGFSGGPRISVYDGAALAQGKQVHPVGDFFLFESTLRNGAYVAVGDVDGDGLADIIGGAGPGGGPRVLVVSGRALVGSGSAAAIASPVANFFAGDTANRDGVRVAAKDLDGDRFADIVTGAGSGGGSRVTTYRGATPRAGQATADLDFDAVADFAGGVFVG